jgi:membrane protein implicated in regulation of membrane protease activity
LAWWHWLLIGIVLLALELLTPGALFLMFFGAGAIAVGLLAATGLAGPLWLQVALFAVLSVAALLSLRRLVTTRLRLAGPAPKVDRLIGETAVALEEMAVDAIGKVELRGTAWTARNIGESTLDQGRRCTVVRVEGLTLWVCNE